MKKDRVYIQHLWQYTTSLITKLHNENRDRTIAS
jgi:hypothetical protein